MNVEIYNGIEIVLRNMAAGHNYREWSEDTISKIYPFIEQIIEDDLNGQIDEGKVVGTLMIDENMVVTAMMMALA